MQKKSAIILLGIKHSGKSTQGRLLAEHFNCPFIDVDEEITKYYKQTPREIYMEKGISGFMSAEEGTCKLIAQDWKNKQVIISTGGGICDNAPALNELRPLGEFVYIDVSEQTACNRILKKATLNPDGSWTGLPAYIVNKKPANEGEVRKIFNGFYTERTEIYKAFADVIVPTKEESKEENTKKILQSLGFGC